LAIATQQAAFIAEGFVMQVGFSIVIREGKAALQIFGHRPGAPRSLIGHARHGEVHAVLMGRLSHRDELLKRLPEYAGLDKDDDVGLALAAYRHAGTAALAGLEGTFALVVWDGCKKVLCGLRDPLGGYPLYWTRTAGCLAVSTGMRPLLSLLPKRELNLDYVAEFLTAPGLWTEEIVTEACVYQGVHRVLPGNMLQATPGGEATQQACWNWLAPKIDPGTSRLEEFGELVEQGLRQAVRQQMRGTIASHVSGGMDSTSVALLARDELRGQPVHAISAVFERLGGLNRETPYLRCALEQPGIVSHLVPSDDLLDYDGFDDPPFHDEPLPKLAVLGVGGRLVEAAAAAGADTLFTGEGADTVLDAYPHHLTDLLRRGRLWAAWREARAWGNATTRSAWHYLWAFGFANLLPATWRGGLGSLCCGGFASWERQAPGTLAPWIRPDFARQHAMRERAVQHLRVPGAGSEPTSVAIILAALKGVSGDGCRWWLAAPHGMTVVHPFLEPRFVRLCMGIQARFRQEPGAMKPLLAEAMRDVLPAPIRNRRVKGHYNSMAHAGMARNLPVLESVIREAPIDELRLFDKECLLRCLQQAALGLAPMHALTRLDLTLAFLRWYSLQEQWQKQPLTPVAMVSPLAA
jgi:asparagine synthase (glutamine-hydrolysing)